MKFDMTLLFALLVVLKVTGVITCSWWIVTLPLWLPVAILGVVFLFILGLFILAAIAQAL